MLAPAVVEGKESTAVLAGFGEFELIWHPAKLTPNCSVGHRGDGL